MSKTFDESLIDTAKISMSILDIEDITDTTSEEFESLRREQQGCHNELTHREDFPFGKYKKTIYLTAGQNTYPLPYGTVKNVWIKNEKLAYSDTPSAFNSQKGKPAIYSVKSNPNKLVFYPEPNNSYNAEVEYYDDRFVLDTAGNPKWEISIGSTLRMPERVQHLYFDALEYFLLAEHIKKISNPRWQLTMEIANARWKVFLNGARVSDSETYIVI